MSLRLAHALIPDEINRYWLALGQFVSAFSAVEIAMQIALRRFAHVRDPIGAALFSGTRTEAAMQYMRRIAEAEKWDKRRRAQIDVIFAQLRLIQNLRNDLLHYGASFKGLDKFAISNRLVAHAQEKIRETAITLPDLQAMGADLATIEVRLLVLARKRGERIHPALRPALRASWQYKPPQGHHSKAAQSCPPGRSRRTGRAPIIQPKA
jgi:hypothetical protein